MISVTYISCQKRILHQRTAFRAVFKALKDQGKVNGRNPTPTPTPIHHRCYKTGLFSGTDTNIEKTPKTHLLVVSDNPKIELDSEGQKSHYAGLFTHCKKKNPNNFKFDDTDFQGQPKNQHIRVVMIPEDEFQSTSTKELKMNISTEQGETIDWFLNVVEKDRPKAYTAKKTHEHDKDLKEDKFDKNDIH